MAHRDMIERDVMSEKLPGAALHIRLFHTLRKFRSDDTAEQLGSSILCTYRYGSIQHITK